MSEALKFLLKFVFILLGIVGYSLLAASIVLIIIFLIHGEIKIIKIRKDNDTTKKKDK